MATEFQTQRIAERNGPRQEGEGTHAIESVTAKAPSGAYLSAAIGAMAASALLQFSGKRHLSLFVGQWAPAILIIGLYNKLVKVAGSA